MNTKALRQLINGGETLHVEFKGEETRSLSDAELVEAVVCLANRPGTEDGWLLVGVEDDRRVTGARHRRGRNVLEPSRIQALIANRTRPSLNCDVNVVEYHKKQVLIIRVPPSSVPVGTADGKYLRRTIGGQGTPECVPFHFSEMFARQADVGQRDYTSLPIPEAGWDALDLLEFERLRRLIRESRDQGDSYLLELSDLELAKALGAVEANHQVTAVRVLGLLLFGKEEALRRFLPTHEVAFQVLAGLEVEVNEFFHWPLLRVMDEIGARFRARNREAELMVGFLRVGIPDYPERAFREALANALIHRDYTRMGAVYVQWHEDRIEISNPGGFPEGVRLDNLLVTPPRPRNPSLADAFRRAGVVERTGRGIDTIFFEQLRNGRPAPSYERSTETDVVLVLHGGQANLNFVRLVTEMSQSGRPLNVEELLVLNRLFLDRRLTIAEVARVIQKGEGEARRSLERLVELGLVEGRGEGRPRAYHLSAATYRRLGAKAEYVRARGFEAVQQEQMILQYIDQHGRITRKEVTDLCQLRSPHQASRLLRKMVREGKLEKFGKLKATWYERAQKI
ncbi:MAG: putative DNA binding domain-containing protein [Deltaproteobacteria bacterium]|nr:putative DNA binding domain-containing protein [Deltaproteobacteria bacterium]